MKRTPLRRGRVRLGQRSRERVRAGGKLAIGRPSATQAAWRAMVARRLERAHGRCERCGSRRAPQPHHVRKRSQGGADSEDNIVILCGWDCHRLVDAPYRDGRLLVAPLTLGHVCFRRVWAEHKGSAPWQIQHEHTPTALWLTAQGLVGPEEYGCPYEGSAV
jgi:hypothetical protein